MKKFLTLMALAVFPFVNANAGTTFKLDAAGDAYFVTDNDKIGFEELRQFAFYNPVKGATSLNHAFLVGRAESDYWRVNVGAGFRGDDLKLHIEEANVAVNLFSSLWAEGGYFVPSLAGDVDYTFDAWFSGNSLTDFMSSDYQAGIGLFSEFKRGITVRLRAINTGYGNENEYGLSGRFSNNRSTTFLAGFDWNEAFGLSDWNLSIGSMIGNEQSYPEEPKLKINSGLHLKGNITSEFEANLRCKFATLAEGKDDGAMATALSAQLMLRYALTEKFGVGCRFAYTIDEDGIFISREHKVSEDSVAIITGYSGMDLGLVFEYRPVSNIYIRLEGNMLMMSNKLNNDLAKIFKTGDNEFGNTRLEAAISMGYTFSLFEITQ